MSYFKGLERGGDKIPSDDEDYSAINYIALAATGAGDTVPAESKLAVQLGQLFDVLTKDDPNSEITIPHAITCYEGPDGKAQKKIQGRPFKISWNIRISSIKQCPVHSGLPELDEGEVEDITSIDIES